VTWDGRLISYPPTPTHPLNVTLLLSFLFTVSVCVVEGLSTTAEPNFGKGASKSYQSLIPEVKSTFEGSEYMMKINVKREVKKIFSHFTKKVNKGIILLQKNLIFKTSNASEQPLKNF